MHHYSRQSARHWQTMALALAQCAWRIDSMRHSVFFRILKRNWDRRMFIPNTRVAIVTHSMRPHNSSPPPWHNAMATSTVCRARWPRHIWPFQQILFWGRGGKQIGQIFKHGLACRSRQQLFPQQLVTSHCRIQSGEAQSSSPVCDILLLEQKRGPSSRISAALACVQKQFCLIRRCQLLPDRSVSTVRNNG
jgi:hypothetical protein